MITDIQIEEITFSPYDNGHNSLFDIKFSYYKDGKKYSILRKSCGICFNAKMANFEDATIFEIYLESVNLDENEIILNGK